MTNSLENFSIISCIHAKFSREFQELPRQYIPVEFKIGGLSVSCQSCHSQKWPQSLCVSAFCQSDSLELVFLGVNTKETSKQ